MAKKALRPVPSMKYRGIYLPDPATSHIAVDRGHKITRIEVYKLKLKLREPFHVAIGVIEHANNLLVRIHSADGMYGIGEGCPIWFVTGETQDISYAAARDCARLLIGRSATSIEDRMSDVGAYLRGNTATKCAFDIALHDLAAKRAGVPLYSFLGGSARTIITDKTVGLGDPGKMADEARNIVNEGFTVIKVKLGTTRREDLARIKAIRSAIGPSIPLRVDANQGWDRPTAVLMLDELAGAGLDFCEQPIPAWDIGGLADLKRRSSIPIMADECLFNVWDAARLARSHASDYFNIKLAKSGGIVEATKINEVAASFGIRCMVGCMLESRVGLSASAHFVSANRNVTFADLDGAFAHSVDPVTGGITYSGGEIGIPDTVGHGADVPAKYLAKLESFVVQAK